MKAVAGTAVIAGLLSAAAATAGPAGYDGRWAVHLVTDSGVCDKSNSYVLAVESGRVRYVPQDTDTPPSISGQISSTGAVTLIVSKSVGTAGVTGQLSGNAGSGTWQAAGLCSGRWTAQKRGPVQASR